MRLAVWYRSVGDGFEREELAYESWLEDESKIQWEQHQLTQMEAGAAGEAALTGLRPTSPNWERYSGVADLDRRLRRYAPSAAGLRIPSMSRIGGAPNIRAYSRLNCDTLW